MYYQRTDMFRETAIIFLIFLTFVGAFKLPIDGKTLKWWQKTPVYQVYPRSFQDTDGNGIGDLKGIEARLDHFKEMGIGCIWLNPIYESPQVDFGYDISNYTKIDPIFGTMEDLISLRKKYQSMGIKVVLDFVPNHTSNQHPWFKKSVKKIDPYTDYYVWKDPKVGETKMLQSLLTIGLVSGSAWYYVSERKQFYLGQFLPQVPELNYRCRYVVEEMKNVLRFYLDRDFNGFRVDSVIYLVEDGRFLDEPPINKTLAAENGLDYNNQQHMYTIDQPETYEILREFREVLDSYTAKGGPPRSLAGKKFFIVINLNNEQEYVDLKTCDWDSLKELNVVISSINSEYDVGSIVNSLGFSMTPKSAFVAR